MTNEYVEGKVGGIYIRFPKSKAGYDDAKELLKLLKMSLDEEFEELKKRGSG